MLDLPESLGYNIQKLTPDFGGYDNEKQRKDIRNDRQPV